MSGNAGIGVAPGSSTYASNTLHVGDGTWDSNRDTFLLPNLMGLNFETMRYNGMGNRFAGDDNYHKIILGHGILAAMVFLFIVPAAIFIPRFYWRSPLYAMKFHIWLQIMTVLLSTVILVLGWFAVGPNRSLSNPHHGIGIAIYVLILFQAMYGWLVRKIEKGRQIPKISIKLMLHQWVGRATALLAITQIALGLALYGSPKILFILYALWCFALLLAWFVFSHRYQGGGGGEDFGSSYYSGGRTDVSGDRESHHHGRKAVGLLAAGGLAATMLNIFRKKKDDGSEHGHGVTQSHHSHHSHHDSAFSGTGSGWSDEKQHRPEKHTWRNRLLAGAGLAAVAGVASKWFGKKEKRHEDSISNASYSVASHPYTASRTDVSRMEEGRAPMTPTQQRIHRTDTTTIPVAAASPSRHSRLHARRSGGSVYSDETHSHYASPGREKQKSHTFRNSIAAMGVSAFLMNKFRRSSRQKEDSRVEELRRRDEEEERRQRRDGGRRFTGDGRVRRTSSYSDSEFTSHPGTTPGHSQHHLNRPGGALAGAAVGAAAASAMHHGSRTHIDESTNSTSQHNLPPPPPLGGVHHDSSGSESFRTNGGNRRHRHHTSGGIPVAAGMAAGAAAADARRRRSSVGSPPLSLKMHTTDTNGRQRVTLRRLSPAEAAAEREAARRRERHGSASSIGGGMSDNERWRRTEAREQAQANEMASNPAANDSRHNITPGSIPPPPPAMHSSSSPPYDLPPPPPIPGSVTAGSGVYDTGGSAAGSRADSNRRRRRAERARAEQARQEGRGNRVDFT